MIDLNNPKTRRLVKKMIRIVDRQLANGVSPKRIILEIDAIAKKIDPRIGEVLTPDKFDYFVEKLREHRDKLTT